MLEVIGRVAEGLAVAVAVALATMMGLAFAGPDATMVWPATGIGVAWLMLRGLRLWPGVFVGFAASAWLHGVPPPCVPAIALGNGLEVVVIAYAVRRWDVLRPTHEKVASLAWFSAVAFAATSLGAGVGVACLAAVGAKVSLGSTWVAWCMGHALGAVIITPLISAFRSGALPRAVPRATESVLLWALTLLVAYFVFAGSGPVGLPLAFLAFPLLAWAALRYGAWWAAAESLVLSLAAIYGAGHGVGPFVDAGVWPLQAFLVVNTGTALGLAAAAAQLRDATDTAEHARRRLQDALQAANMVTWSWGEKYPHEGRDPYRLVGYIGRFMERVVPEDRPAVRRAIDLAIQRSTGYEFEFRHIGSDGSLQWSAAKGQVLIDSVGRPAGLVGVERDLTSYKRMQTTAREREDHFRTILAHTSDAIFVLDPKSRRIMLVNRRACEMLGYSESELLDLPLSKIHPNEMDLLYEFMGDVFGRGYARTSELSCRTKAGRHVPAEIAGSRVELQGKQCMIAVVRDISDRKRVERELRASEERYRALVEHAPDAVVVVDPETGRFIDANERATHLFGLSAAALLKTEISALAPTVQPGGDSSADAWDRHAGTIMDGGRASFEWTLRRADGKQVETDVRLSRMPGEDRWLVRGSLADISDRKRVERQRQALEKRLQQSQNLERLGVLAGGVAHDFNNLLTGILANASLARADLGADDAVHEALGEIETASRRAAELCRQMLTYAGKGPTKPEPVDLSKVGEETASLLRLSVDRRATLDFDLADDLPMVSADVTQLRQTVMNLVINASDALEGKPGTIRMRTGVADFDEETLARAAVGGSVSPGRFVYIEVSDDGCGIEAETKDKIFDPFFSTKFTGRGLGLSATRGVVQSHGGALLLDSEPGRGSTFRLLLPVDSDPEQAEMDVGGPGAILLVDDEAQIRRVARRVLERCGFRVIEAPDGETALRHFRERRKEIRAVLLDRSLPGVDGDETCRQMIQIDPAIPVVMTSGFSSAAEDAPSEAFGFLPKPFDAHSLRTTIQRATQS